MFRLSAPTMRTFAIAGPAIVLGILSWLDVFGLGIDADVASPKWACIGLPE